jgi:hypothetical protein
LYTQPAILEISYELAPAGEGEGKRPALFDDFRTTLHPPQLGGGLFLGRTRWLVEAPAGEVVLHAGHDATLEQEWGLKGWLLAPRPTASRANLEAWLNASPAAVTGEEEDPGLVCWQTNPTRLHLVHVPERAWLLGWSMVCLAVGLGVALLPRGRAAGRFLLGLVVAAVGLGVAGTALFWPGVLPAILLGCEPGAAVLVVVLAIHWTVQRRYRRQLVFMPGFTRLKAGSSLLRGGTNNRPREPSTVDGPAPALPPDNAPPLIPG